MEFRNRSIRHCTKRIKDYTQNDTVGKAGMEQYYETYLRGKNGEQKFYIDNVGKNFRNYQQHRFRSRR